MIHILFVCTGNTCRSPMAEAILKSKNITGLVVKSAGVFAVNGSPASQNAQKVLEEERIHHSHQSSTLSKELIDWASYIFTMTKGHKESVLSMFPEAKEKTYSLKEFAKGDGSGDIIDPFGGSLEIYRNTYRDIYENIEAILPRLKI